MEPVIVSGKITLKSIAKSLFNRTKDDFDQPSETRMHSIFNKKMHEYTSIASSIVGMMAPKSAVSRGFDFMRNIMLLDTLSDVVGNKIEPCMTYSSVSRWTKWLGEHKTVKCPINLMDFGIQCTFDMDVAGMLAVHLGQMKIGTRFTIKSFNSTRKRIDLGMELIYRSTEVVFRNGDYELVDASADHVDFILKSADHDEYILVNVHALRNSNDSTRRYISLSTAGNCLWIGRTDLQLPCTLPSLAYSMIDQTRNYLIMRQSDTWLVEKTWSGGVSDDELPYTSSNLMNIKEILRGIEKNISRSYAIVGVPGTGKTRLMHEVRARCKDSLLLDITDCDLAGDSYYAFNKFRDIIHTAPHNHLLVLMDDMDKTDYIDQVSKRLIRMFEELHNYRPGGEGKLSFTFIATINNPKMLANAVIKRSNRFDEVIKMDMPSIRILGMHLNQVKDASNDHTNYCSVLKLPALLYMKLHSITLADIGNIYSILSIKTKKDSPESFGNWALIKAARTIVKNKRNAQKEYVL